MNRRQTRKCIVGLLSLCAILSLGLGLASKVWAQSTTDGAIGGTVYDPSGAVVPNATVTVHNNGTNLAQTMPTDASGYYRVTKLQPATYTVTITASGFEKFKAEQVIVQVGSVTELSPHLVLGVSGQTVEVTGDAPQINLTSADFSPTLDQTAISNLPIQRPRWSNFALLTPGVVNDSNGFGLLSFRGISTLLNNNTIDGADNNQAFFSEERGRTRISYSSAEVSIQEFQVNTSNYSAEYGRAAGGVVNTVTKSGTNDFHGELYYKNRENGWAARNPFATITEQTSPGVYAALPFKPTDYWDIWGLGVGGPIVRDKLFFFFAYDGFKRNFPGTSVANSPSAFFASPLSDLTNYGGACSSLNSSAIQGLVNGANILTATQGACNLYTRLNLANYAAGVTQYINGLNGLISELGPTPRTGNQDIFFPKLDWQINQKNRASFDVNRMRWSSPAGIQTQVTNTYATHSFGNDYVADTWGVGKLETLFTPMLSNEVRYQYGRDFEWENNQAPTAYEQSNFVTSANFPAYTNPYGLPPDAYITNGFDMGVPTFLNRPAYPDERRQQVADSVTWAHGNHIIKLGGDFNHVHDLAQNLRYQYGSFSYTNIGNYLSDLYKPDSCTSGGKPAPCYSSFNQAFGPLAFAFSTNDVAFFVEENWKALPRLSLNVGLRYEAELLPAPFSNVVNPAVPQTGVFPSLNHNFGPRIGLAYDVFGNGKTSLRGGYGIYYGRLINSTIYSALTATGVPGTSQLQYTWSGATLTSGPTFPQILSSSGSATIKPSIVFFDSNFKLPQIHETDLTLEQDLGWGTVLSVSYLGSFGRHLPDFVDTNLPSSPSPITYTVSGGGPVTTPTYTTVLYTGVRPNTSFNAMTDIFSGVNTNYNALAIQVNHRVSRNVQFTANYTWSHALDYGENATTFTDTNDLLVPNNLRLEYGNSNFNVPNRFVLTMLLNSPWHVKGPIGYLANGWEMAPICGAQNGLPYSLGTSGTAPGAVSGGGGINGSNGRKGIDIIGRNTFRMPGQQDLDLRLSKKIAFKEKYSLELMGEAFNLFNHFNATGVNTTGYIVGGTAAAPTLTYNPPFGSVTSANSNFAYSTRQIQLGLRFLF